MTRRLAGFMMAAAITAGCEHGISLRGQVQIPGDVQAQFSKDAPGLVVFGGGFGNGTLSAQLLAVLCDPTPQPLAIPVALEQRGCAAEGTAWFKVTKLAPGDRAGLTCGVHQEDFDALVNSHRISVPASFDKDHVVAQTTVTIFKGGSGVCRNGVDTIDATVKLGL